jgi:hypothetical protein
MRVESLVFRRVITQKSFCFRSKPEAENLPARLHNDARQSIDRPIDASNAGKREQRILFLRRVVARAYSRES